MYDTVQFSCGSHYIRPEIGINNISLVYTAIVKCRVSVFGFGQLLHLAATLAEAIRTITIRACR